MKAEKTCSDEQSNVDLTQAVVTRNISVLSRYITQWQITDTNGILRKSLHLYTLLQIFFGDDSLHIRRQPHFGTPDTSSNGPAEQYFFLVTNKTTQHPVLLTLLTTHSGDQTKVNIQYSPRALAYYLGWKKPLLHFLLSKGQIDQRISKYITHQLSYPTYFLRMQKHAANVPAQPLKTPNTSN